MRQALLLALTLVLAGCASAPTDPTPATVPSRHPSPVLPPVVTTGTPTPATPDPPTPAPEAPWTEANGSWSIEWHAEAIDATYGQAIPFVAKLRHPEPVPSASFSFSGQWIDSRAQQQPISEPATRLEGVYYAGEGPLSATLVEDLGDLFYGFSGPTIRVVGERGSTAFEARTDVSDDAPGLSTRVEGRRVIVTYAAEANATTTADERIHAEDLVLVEEDGAWSLVAFVIKAQSDAVAPLPEMERPRVIAVMDDVPAGEITVRAISRVSCFCFVLPAPVVEESVVEVRGS